MPQCLAGTGCPRGRSAGSRPRARWRSSALSRRQVQRAAVHIGRIPLTPAGAAASARRRARRASRCGREVGPAATASWRGRSPAPPPRASLWAAARHSCARGCRMLASTRPSSSEAGVEIGLVERPGLRVVGKIVQRRRTRPRAGPPRPAARLHLAQAPIQRLERWRQQPLEARRGRRESR